MAKAKDSDDKVQKIIDVIHDMHGDMSVSRDVARDRLLQIKDEITVMLYALDHDDIHDEENVS